MLAYPDRLDEHTDAIQWADWLELCLLFSPVETISRSDLWEILELRSVAEGDAERIIDDAFYNGAARESLLAERYPVEQVGVRLSRRRRREQCLCFSFLLALGTRHFYSAPRVDDETARLFEYVVTSAVRRYLHGQVVRIGARREDPVPRPLRDVLQYLGKLTGEVHRTPVNRRAQDESVDVVGWLPFVDGRPGQIVLLTQCKTQQDWDHVLNAISMNVWSRQMDWCVAPVPAFAFPYVFDERRYDRAYISLQGGIPFDRLRLSELARDEDLPDDVRGRIARWCDVYATRLPTPSSLT